MWEIIPEPQLASILELESELTDLIDLDFINFLNLYQGKKSPRDQIRVQPQPLSASRHELWSKVTDPNSNIHN